MRQFVDLFEELDRSTRTNEKILALSRYFSLAPDEDKVWAIALFLGKAGRKTVNSRMLREWAQELSGMEAWLFEESYGMVGDLAETIALLVAKNREKPSEESESLHTWMLRIAQLKDEPEEIKKSKITGWWLGFSTLECLVFNKLITGGFRIGVSQQLLIRGLAATTQLEAPTLSHRLMGKWQPESTSFAKLILEKSDSDDLSKPYPFCLAYPLESTGDLGPLENWLAEWKWDGIRCQLIKRQGEISLWSRGEDLITDKFPELVEAAKHLLDGIVLDAELLAYKNNQILPFQTLQTRISRKNVSKKQLQESPCVLFVYDLLELNGDDWRGQPFLERRMQLEKLLSEQKAAFYLSPAFEFSSLEEASAMRSEARSKQAEGLMLKRKSSVYHTGRKRGDWWKWKLDPYQIDAVLLYAQKGHGRRADLFTDYTLGLWHEGKLVTIAKAYSGLTDAEIKEVDAFIRKNTLEKFGPVRTVKPQLVFEIGFEGIQASTRHKAGVAVRFPRILRWRKDKQAQDADQLETLKSLIAKTED